MIMRPWSIRFIFHDKMALLLLVCWCQAQGRRAAVSCSFASARMLLGRNDAVSCATGSRRMNCEDGWVEVVTVCS